jgi:hypothetical protein
MVQFRKSVVTFDDGGFTFLSFHSYTFFLYLQKPLFVFCLLIFSSLILEEMKIIDGVTNNLTATSFPLSLHCVRSSQVQHELLMSEAVSKISEFYCRDYEW